MARRRDDGLLTFTYELMRGLFGIIPPWTCLPLAALTFAFFHLSFARHTALEQLGTLLGFVFALAIILAGFKAWQERATVLRHLSESIDFDWINKLSWRDFEKHLAEVYRQQGYSVECLGGQGPDGGVDLRLRKGGEITLVQCKHWRSWRVGVPVVRELFGVLHAEKANRAILISSGRFTQEAERFAAGKPIELINGSKLITLLRQFQREQNQAASPKLEYPLR